MEIAPFIEILVESNNRADEVLVVPIDLIQSMGAYIFDDEKYWYIDFKSEEDWREFVAEPMWQEVHRLLSHYRGLTRLRDSVRHDVTIWRAQKKKKAA